MPDDASDDSRAADPAGTGAGGPQDPIELPIDTAGEDSGSGGADSDSGGASGHGLSTEQVATLHRMLRVAYPHPTFPDAPYERTAKTVQDADDDELLAAGLDALNAAAGGDFAALSDAEATAALERIADSPFFKLVHSTTVVALYDDHEVWELLGYQGSSFDKGGYLHRGFDDLDWLPSPRIDEAAEPRVEIVPSSEEQA